MKRSEKFVARWTNLGVYQSAIDERNLNYISIEFDQTLGMWLVQGLRVPHKREMLREATVKRLAPGAPTFAEILPVLRSIKENNSRAVLYRDLKGEWQWQFGV